MNPHLPYMQRCFDLALKGYGFVSPNPMVGCVIVRSGRTVAEGYHRRLGEAHAETEALKRAGAKAKGATLYVNLEPCVHFGRTPPCADAIIGARIRKVVAAVKDPHSVVAGKGFRKLREAGVSVEVGILRAQAESLNEKFFAFNRSGYPFVGVKVAQTLDAKIADERGDSKWITSKAARVEAHRLRAGYDAVIVGAQTVTRDNPQLTVRYVAGRNPVRVVIDGKLNISPNLDIFNTRTAQTILLTLLPSFKKRWMLIDKLEGRGVKVIPLDGQSIIDIKEVLKLLGALGFSSVLVEGGGQTIASFMSARRVDKVHCFVSPKLLGGGKESFPLNPPLRLHRSIRLMDVSLRTIGNDYLVEGHPVFS